ncbi:NUDIX hydrolase [Candidatus Bathyarchaeota archaeon]|nr:NUDIX hydrolase [Candidatus Bathyarchaeota archaeon]
MSSLNSTNIDYPTGPYSIGVGAIIESGGRILLVKINYGHKGWMLPGGYVRPYETIGDAVKREVLEETGLQVEPTELVSVRSRVEGEKSDIYLTFTVKINGGELKPDGKEVSEARYFTLDEINSMSNIPKIFQLILNKVLSGRSSFGPSSYRPMEPEKYELWL